MSTTIKSTKSAKHSTGTGSANAPTSAVAAAASTTAGLPAPPPSATIPTPPSGANTPGGENYRAFMPRKVELAALPGAVADLEACTNFAQVFGATGLPYGQVLQAFQVANVWSTMRAATAGWDAYCQTQEGICWGVLRPIMDILKRAFNVAMAGDPSLASSLPSFATLFQARNVIAQKGASTRRLNKAAMAQGAQPLHGSVGKRRYRAAAKAALATQTARGGGQTQASAPTSTGTSTGGASSAPSAAAAPTTSATSAAAPAQTETAGPGTSHS